MTEIERKPGCDIRQRFSRSIGLCLFLCQLAGADDSVPNLRRVYIPTDRVAELGDRYGDLQVLSRTEFDQLVARARSAGVPSDPRVVSCKLQAVLQTDRLLGTGQLEIRGDRESATLVRWPVSQLLISECRWESSDASFGYLGQGDLGLVVPAGEIHKLNFRWMLAARSSVVARRLEFRLPSSSSAELVLDLPREITPIAEQATSSDATDSPNSNLKRWSIRLSPADPVKLQLESAAGARPFSSLIFYEREMEAEVTEQATEVLARFNVNVAHQPVRQFQFSCSPDLEVLGWSGIKVHDWQTHDGLVTVYLSEPLLGAAQITVRALAHGPTDGHWQLPKFLIQNAIWSGGKTRFRTATGLTAFNLQPVNSKILSVEELSAGRTEFLVQHAVADASLSAAISFDVPEVFAKVATILKPGFQLEADTTITWEVASGELTRIQILLPASWLVQDITEEPDGQLAGWADKAAGDSNEHLVTLRLNRALTSNSTFTTKLHLSGPIIESESLPSKFAVPRVRPIHAYLTEELLTLQKRSQWSAMLVESSHMTAISPRPDFDEPSLRKVPAMTYRFDREDSTGTMAVHRESSDFAAEIDVRVRLDERFAKTNYVIDAEKIGGQIEWLDVAFSASTANGLVWNLPEGSRAERLDDAAESETAAELWRVFLPKSLHGNFRLEAKWHASAIAHDIPLPSIARATETKGRVAVAYPDDFVLIATSRGLREGAMDRDQSAASGRATASRQQSWQFSREMPTLSVRVAPNPDLLTSKTFVRHTRLTSKLDGHGNAIHRIRYLIQSRSGAEFTVELPGDASLRDVRSSGLTVEPSSNGVVRLKCPASTESCELELEYATSGRGFGIWGSQVFDLPRTSLPSLRFSWTVETSSNHAAIAWSRGLVPVPPYAARSWTRRLFGPLARVTGERTIQSLKLSASRAWQNSRDLNENDPLASRLQQELAKYNQEVQPRDRSWARLVSILDQIADRRLVLDATAIDEAGIQLSNNADLNNDTSATSLLGLIREAELNLLRTKHGLLLTSHAESKRLAVPDSRTGLRSLGARDSLVEAIDRALLNGADASGRFVLLSEWSETSWRIRDRDPGARSESFAGNFIQRFESAEQLSTLSIEWVETGFVVRLTSFVICFALLLMCCRRTRPAARWLVASAGVSMTGFILAIAVPEPLSAPSAALGWGFFAVFFVWTRLTRTRTAPDSLSTPVTASPDAITKVGTPGLLLILLICLPQAFSAECQDDTQREIQFSPVFIPYDPAQPEKAVDSSRVLVPRATYERLAELAKRTSDIAGQVLVRSISCNGKLADDRVSLSLEMELEKISGDRPSRCSLPLSGMTIRSARLDGESCLLLPEPSGIAVELAGQGLHRLTIDGLIGLDRTANSGTFDLTIPPAPANKLDIELPADMRLTVDTAIGSELRGETDKQRFLATLGATGQLSIGWGRGPMPETVLQSDSASLLTWNSGHFEIERRMKVTAVTGSFTRLTIDVDDRLLLQEVTAPGLAGYWLQSAGEKAQLLLEFQRPIEKQVALVLKFQAATPVDGSFPIPAVQLVGSTPGTRVWAMCDGSGERLPLQDLRGLIAASPEDFLSIWGDSPPRLANMNLLKQSVDVAGMLVDKFSDTARPSLQTQTQFRVSRTRIETIAQYSSQPASGGVFRHEFRLPTQFHLTSVRASAGTQWHSVGPDRLLWFGRGATGSGATIELNGWSPVATDSQPLPAVRPIGDCKLGGEVSLWRTRDIRLSPHDVHGMKRVRSRSDPKAATAGFLTDSIFEVETDDFAASLHMEAQSPRVTVDVANRVLVQDEAAEWIAVVDYQVSDGAINSIELSIPDSILEPIQFVAEGVYRRDVRRDGSNLIWTIQLEEPQGNDYRLVLHSKIEMDPSGRYEIPLIAPRKVAEVRQHLLVLNDAEQRVDVRGDEYQAPVPIERFGKWFSEQRTAGVVASLELVNLDQKMEIHRPQPSDRDIPQPGLLERHQCWLRSSDELLALVGWLSEPTQLQPRNSRLREPTYGSLLVESRLLVRTQPAKPVTLTLPRTATLLEIQADGRNVSSFWNSEDRLVVPLDSRDQVRELRVFWNLSLSSEPNPSDTRRVGLPRLLPSECPSVWTIHNADGLNVGSSNPAPTDRSQAELVLATMLVGEVERTLAMRRGRDATDWTADVQDLQQRFASAVDTVRRTIEAQTLVGQFRTERRSNIDRARFQLSEVVQRNKTMMDRAGLTALRLRAETLEQRARSAIRMIPLDADRLESEAPASRRLATTFELPHGQNARFVVTSARGASLFLKRSKFSRIQESDWMTAAIAGSVILAVCGLLGSSAGRRFGSAFLLALAGAVWCWKLEPALVGPFLLLIAAVAALFAKFRQKQNALAS